MRFEIGGGGIAAIAVALALLSGAVFFLGMFAGYDVGRESQVTSAQVATAYPVQSPPAAAQSNAEASAATPVPVESAASATSPSEAANPSEEPDDSSKGIEEKNIGSGASSKSDAMAQAESPTPSPSAGAPSDTANSNPPKENSASAAPVPHPTRHKPYNIQIRAAMDLNGGNAMMKRLGELGYQSHLIPTQIAGQTWYRVEIGPYASQEEAAAAEAALRQKYNSAYGAPRPAQAAQPQSSAQSTAQRAN
jgi:septal ring-binding cell division protein DamX